MTYHKLFKFIIVGDKYVGKTSILNKWLDPFRDIRLYQNTIGVEFGSKIYSINRGVKTDNRLNIEKRDIKVHYWDTAGQEEFFAIIKSYFRNIAGIIVVFDLNDRNSFDNINMWCNQIDINNNCADDHVHPILILGNKSDKGTCISKEEIDKKVNELDAIYYEVSAMTNKNLDKAIHALINKVYDNTILLNLKNSSCSGIKNGVMEYVKRYKKRDNSCYIDNQCCSIM